MLEKKYSPQVAAMIPLFYIGWSNAVLSPSEIKLIQDKIDASNWLSDEDKKLLDEIEEYNKQDCISTFKLRNWLLKIKPEGTKWFVPEKDQMELRSFEENLLEYQKKISSSKLSNKPMLKLLSDVIGFYNREQKPQWRQFFDRKDLGYK